MTIFKPKRAKIYGLPHGGALDRNAKARIVAYAKAWTARHRQPGQHTGPITRAFMEVLRALLFAFHNSKSGWCFPSYEKIMEAANCSRDTVREAIKVLELADVLTWAHRLRREGGKLLRTSNAYSFRDPNPNADKQAKSSKTENSTGNQNQGFSLLNTDKERVKVIVLDPSDPMDRALIAFGRAQGALATPGA